MFNMTEKQQGKKPNAAIQYILTRAGIAYDFYVTGVVNPGGTALRLQPHLLQKKARLDEVPFRGGAFPYSSLWGVSLTRRSEC